MKGLNLTTLLIAIIGAINWGLIGFFNFNLVSAIFGVDTALTNIIYIIVGVSGLYQLYPFSQACSTNAGEITAERGNLRRAA